MENECELSCDEQYCDVCYGKPSQTMADIEHMIATAQYQETSKRQDEIIDLLRRNTECLEQCAERLNRAIDAKYPIGGMRTD